MLERLNELFHPILGLGIREEQLHPAQIFARGLVVYVVTVVLVQLGSRRFLGRASIFDSIIAIMLGSIMSRGVTGSPLLQTFAAGAALIALHWVFAFLAYHTENFGLFVKGNPIQLIKDGEIQPAQMRKAKISRRDLEQALRLEVRHADPNRIRAAYLERNGRISFIPYRHEEP